MRFGDGPEHRSVYGPLSLYTWLQTFRTLYETLPQSEFGKWDENMRAWADILESELGRIVLPHGPIPAQLGGDAAQAAWIALALHIAGKIFIRDAWTDLAADTFGRLTRAQSPTGTFLTPTSDDNLEMFWYDELTILHAAASYSVQTEDRPLAAAVHRATNFHFAEIQPDHATAQPWGLFAFIWNPQTHSLADQLLHSMRMSQPEKLGEIPLMLLADSLYCIRLFL